MPLAFYHEAPPIVERRDFADGDGFMAVCRRSDGVYIFWVEHGGDNDMVFASDEADAKRLLAAAVVHCESNGWHVNGAVSP